MNILEGATLYLDNKPLKGNPAKHFEALADASKQGKVVGFTQAQPPKLLATLFTDLTGEEALSDKLLELITADVTPTLILDGPSGLVGYYLLDEELTDDEWQRLGEALAKQYGGTPAMQEEILPLPGFCGTTLLHTSDAPLTRNTLVEAFPTEEAAAAQSASVKPRVKQNDSQALRDAIEATDLPALVAHHYPESGAKPGVASAVKAVWRGDENPSFSLFRSNNGGTWRYRDHATGETGNAFGFLVDILQMPKAEAAETFMVDAFTTPRTPAPVRQVPEKVKTAAKKPTVKSRIVKTYAYTDEHYNLLFEVVRFMPKRFAQRRRDPETGAWVWGLKAGGYIKGANGDWIIPKNGEPAEREFEGCRHVLYHLPQLIASKGNEETVYLVEGEKDVETLESFDLTATCNPMGSLKWHESYTEVLSGRRVVNLCDNDEAGEKHAAMVCEALREETNFSNVLLPGLPTGGDVTDWFDAGNTLGAFLELTSHQQQVSEASYEEMQTALWRAVNAGTVQSFVHPLSNMELSPSNAHYCLKDALETPQKKDSERVISRAYSLLPNAGTPIPMPQTQEETHA
jgi:hypothetical protein